MLKERTFYLFDVQQMIHRPVAVFVFIIIMNVVFVPVSVPEALAADEGTIRSLEKRMTDLEKKTADLAARQEHTDKHLSHMKDVVPRAIDGLSIAGGLTMVIQGTQGNDRNDPPGEDVTDGSMSADLEVDTEIGEKGEAFLLMEMAAGEGLQDDEILSFWGVNDDARDSDAIIEVTEAWYEHRFMDNRLLFTVGLIDLTNYFDGNEVANDEKDQFLASGFVNSIAVEFPLNALGSRLTWNIHEFAGLSLGWQDGDGDSNDIFRNGFYIIEADVRPKFGTLEGNYRGYYWINSVDHVKIGDPESDNAPGWGVGMSIDQQVPGGITVFGRLGYQDEEVYEFDTVWSAGAAMNGDAWGRENDTAALAYGVAMLSDDHKVDLRSDGIDTEDESHFEAYYKVSINEHVAVSPDIQIVLNALGDADYETVWVWGLRGQVTF